MNHHVISLALTSAGLAACGGDTVERPACDVPGEACTWLGVPGEVGFTKDGADRRDAVVYWTMDTLFASDGVVWFIDWNNHLVRKITTDDTIHSVVGWDDPVFPGDGNIEDPTAERSPDGDDGSNIQLNHPTDLLEATDGTILMMAWHNHKIRTIDPATGRVKVLTGAGPGYADGPFATARFRQPSRFVQDETGNLFVLDQANQRIRKLDMATQMVSTIAGKGTQGFSGDGGPAMDAQLFFEAGANPEPGGGIAYANNMLYIGDTENHRIRRIDLATNTITTLAGTGEPGYTGDGGPAASARLHGPRDLEIGPDGRLYVADTDNGAVRAIDLASGVIETFAGCGELGYAPNNDLDPKTMLLHRTFGLDFDTGGNLYVSDSLNSRIVRITK